jgi:hypothetical protein
MSAVTMAPRISESPPAGVAEATDLWPHTKRPLPWLLAAFLVMVFLVPFEGITFKVHLPANLTPDRLLIVLMVGILVLNRLALGRESRRRMTPVEVAIVVFGAVALLSVVLNVARIYREGQLTYVEKGFMSLAAYGTFFFVVVKILRSDEVPAFSRLILVLGCLTALGTLYEAHSGYNVFYNWSAKLLSPIATVIPSPTRIHITFGQKIIVGPTQHGLALASMLTMALPFAVLPLLEPRRPSRRFAYLFIVGLILAADFSTGHKTAFLAPMGAFIVLIAYKRQLLRWTPLALVALVPVIHFASPGALGTLTGLVVPSANADYTDGRASDYGAIAPDVFNNVLIGRGYGTLDSHNWRWYRILDNNYLDELFELGFIGLLAYLAVIVAALGTAHGVIKGGGRRAPPALAAAAGCAAFGVVSATFDAMGFSQAPYLFLFAAGLIAVLARAKRDEAETASFWAELEHAAAS